MCRKRPTWLLNSLCLAIILAALALIATAEGLLCTRAISGGGPGSAPSITGTLQTLRSQIDFYKFQHDDHPPSLDKFWTSLANRSFIATVDEHDNLGSPYIPQPLANPANGQTAVSDHLAPCIGWIYKVDGNNYTLSAVNTTGNAILTY